MTLASSASNRENWAIRWSRPNANSYEQLTLEQLLVCGCEPWAELGGYSRGGEVLFPDTDWLRAATGCRGGLRCRVLLHRLFLVLSSSTTGREIGGLGADNLSYLLCSAVFAATLWPREIRDVKCSSQGEDHDVKELYEKMP